MKKIVLVIFLTTVLWVNLVHALEVDVICKEGASCTTLTTKIKKAIKDKKNVSSIRESLRFILLDESVSELEFEISSSKVEINFSQRPIIKDVNLTGKYELNEKVIFKTLRVTEGGYYESVKLNKGIERLREYYKERGYEKVEIIPNVTKTDLGITLNININTGEYVLIGNVQVQSESIFLKDYVKSHLLKLRKKPWNLVNIKIELDSLTRDLFGRGYFSSSLEMNESEVTNGKRDLIVNVKAGLLYNFDFRGNKIILRGELLNSIKEFLLNSFEKVDPEIIIKAIEKIYESKGIYETKIDYRKQEGAYKSGDRFVNLYFYIREGEKIPVEEIEFEGVTGISVGEVEDFYYNNATDLANRDYLDSNFIKEFPSLLKRFYLKRGYLFIEVSEPVLTFSPDKKSCKVKYSINERQQSILDDIVFPKVDKNLIDSILPELINKVGSPLNVVDLEEDLNKSLTMVKDNGYYFASIRSLEPANILKHKDNFNRSEIHIDFDLGKKTRFESVLVTGLNLTQSKVVTREVKLEKGDLITPAVIQNIRRKIIGLGLFSQVKITPFVTNRESDELDYFVNILIQVSEKDFGSGEIAPGYRTDLGYKISTKVAYNNLLGLNHSASIKAQTNIRDNLNSLDARRKEQNRNLQEYLVRFNYTWPYAFPSRWEWFHDTELSFSPSVEQRRLFGFDAEILKVSSTLNKDIWSWFHDKYKLTGSLKYQYEKIRQYNASATDNDGKFIIGGLTPGLNLDLRDNPVNPTKGAFFGLSMEFANPMFGSLDREDLEINFWKLVSRNKFYYPVTPKWTLALSISTGVQKNLETGVVRDSSGNTVQNDNNEVKTRGFIPSIKVFRLDGPDMVRGYATSEINRLVSETDISQYRVQNKAFFMNMKFEPRFSLNDAVVFGPFFDAGRIYINNYKPLELRTSTGVSLKFVTPAGTLDFDYGIKLKRRRLSDGGREGFGRFHLSIGFF